MFKLGHGASKLMYLNRIIDGSLGQSFQPLDDF